MNKAGSQFVHSKMDSEMEFERFGISSKNPQHLNWNVEIPFEITWTIISRNVPFC